MADTSCTQVSGDGILDAKSRDAPTSWQACAQTSRGTWRVGDIERGGGGRMGVPALLFRGRHVQRERKGWSIYAYSISYIYDKDINFTHMIANITPWYDNILPVIYLVVPSHIKFMGLLYLSIKKNNGHENSSKPRLRREKRRTEVTETPLLIHTYRQLLHQPKPL